MTVTTIFSLFFTLLVLAAIPGLGVLMVVSRGLLGFRHGLAASIGVVCGDYVFIALSLLGLSALAQSMGNLFHYIQYAGALYLVWLGIGLLRIKTPTDFNLPQNSHAPTLNANATSKVKPLLLINSFNTGFMTTLGNPKAIVFYASFFPAFVDINALDWRDVAIILGLVLMAVGGVMAAYAFAASHSRHWFARSPFQKKATLMLNRIAGGIMVVSGFWLLWSGW